jgi:hypothetical protein
VEEHDCIDLRLSCFLSRELRTLAVAVHASEGSDTYGFCTYHNGELARQLFQEREERPLNRIDQTLEIKGIPYRVSSYRDCHGPGWIEVTLDP